MSEVFIAALLGSRGAIHTVIQRKAESVRTFRTDCVQYAVAVRQEWREGKYAMNPGTSVTYKKQAAPLLG